jgi:multicomponent Na+:H+ antiporter subunit B
MRPAHRCGLMLAAAAALLGFYVWGVTGLPHFGDTVSVYGTTIDSVVSAERQTTNAVSAIVFDYRGFDTLGEELILFISVVGVSLLLREQRDESDVITPEAEKAESAPRSSEAVRALGVLAVGATFLVGLYVVVHGHLTPGGGFQGGVVLAAAVLLVYFAGDFLTLRTLQPMGWMDVTHAAGAGGLGLLALGGLIAGGAFFHNFLPTGTGGLLLSGGTIPLDNVAVGVEVFGAVVLLGSEFLHDAVIARRPESADGS